jgi:hypothetical protein
MKLKTLYIILFTLVTLHAPEYIESAESIVVKPTLTITATMSAGDVSVITDSTGKLEYTLIDSTMLDLFNYLNNEIKEDIK